MAHQLQLSFIRQLLSSTTCSLSLEDPNVPLSLELEPEPRISGAQGITDVAIMRCGTVGSWHRRIVYQMTWTKLIDFVDDYN